MRFLKSLFCKVFVSEKGKTRVAGAFVMIDDIVSEAELMDVIDTIGFFK